MRYIMVRVIELFQSILLSFVSSVSASFPHLESQTEDSQYCKGNSNSKHYIRYHPVCHCWLFTDYSEHCHQPSTLPAAKQQKDRESHSGHGFICIVLLGLKVIGILAVLFCISDCVALLILCNKLGLKKMSQKLLVLRIRSCELGNGWQLMKWLVIIS